MTTYFVPGHGYVQDDANGAEFLVPGWLWFEAADAAGGPTAAELELAVRQQTQQHQVSTAVVGYAGIADSTTWNFTTEAGATIISPSPVAGTGSVRTPTVGAGSGISPSTVAGAGAIPNPTVDTPIEIAATAVTGTGAFGTPTIATGSTIAATPVAGAGAFGTPTVATFVDVPATAIPGTGHIQQVTVGAGSNISATPLAGAGHVASPEIVGHIGVMPTLAVEAAFGDVWNEASLVWTDLSAYAEVEPPLRISRGNMDPFSRPRPSEAYVTLNNQDRRFDPSYAAGDYYGDLLPMVPVRMYATVGGTDYPLFRGFAAGWPNVAAMSGHDPTVELVARDGLSVLNLYAVSAAGYVATILSSDPRAWWRFQEAAGSTTASESVQGWDIPAVTATFGETGNTAVVGATDLAISVFEAPALKAPIAAGFTGVDPAYSIEAWVKSSTSVAVQTVYWQNITGGTTDYIILHIWTDGTVRAGALGNGFAYSLTSTTDITDGSWHRIVLTSNGTGDRHLWIDGVDETSVASDTGTLTHATPTDIYVAYVPGSDDTLYLSELLLFDKELSDAEIADHAAGTAWGGDLTSERITRILDLVSWPVADRDLDTGETAMIGLAGAASTIDLVYQTTDTEWGRAWLATDGDFTFRNRSDRNISTYAATFSNDGSDIAYQDITYDAPDLRVRTIAEVTDAGETQTFTASKNTATYGQRLVTVATQTSDTSEAQTLADWIANTYSDPHPELRLLIQLGRGSDYSDWTTMLGLEIGDLVSVEATPVAGGAQNQWDCFVETIDLTCGPNTWDFALGLSNAENQRMFIFDDPILGEFDGVGRLGW